MVDLPFARMHAIHLPSEQMITALHPEWNAIPQNSIKDIIDSMRMHMNQQVSNILLNALKTVSCLFLRRIKMY